jgi:hypothetical protein
MFRTPLRSRPTLVTSAMCAAKAVRFHHKADYDLACIGTCGDEVRHDRADHDLIATADFVKEASQFTGSLPMDYALDQAASWGS